MHPDDLAAWLPVLRDVLALLAGIALGAYGLVHHDPWVTVPGFALAGLAVDVRASLLVRLLRLLSGRS